MLVLRSGWIRPGHFLSQLGHKHDSIVNRSLCRSLMQFSWIQQLRDRPRVDCPIWNLMKSGLVRIEWIVHVGMKYPTSSFLVNFKVWSIFNRTWFNVEKNLNCSGFVLLIPNCSIKCVSSNRFWTTKTGTFKKSQI